MDPTVFTTGTRAQLPTSAQLQAGGQRPAGGYGEYRPAEYQPQQPYYPPSDDKRYPSIGVPQAQEFGRPYGEQPRPQYGTQYGTNYTGGGGAAPPPPPPPPYGQQYFQQQPPQQQQFAYASQPPPTRPDYQQGGGGGSYFGFGGEENAIPPDKLITEDLDIAIRHAFVRKVYGILTSQLLITFGLTAMFVFFEPARRFLAANMWLSWVALGVYIVTVLVFSCCCSVGRTFPINYILLGIIAVSMGVLLGGISGRVSTLTFLLAVGATAVVTFAVSIFACQTRFDFTGCGVFVFVTAIILAIFGIVMIFIHNRVAEIVYGALGTVLFSFYIIYDTQQIVGGKHRKYEFSIDDYAFGALALYLDIINLFLFLLRLIGAARGE